MKLHILCEKCGCDSYKKISLPFSLKHRVGLYHVPIFKCTKCGQKYIIGLTYEGFIFELCCIFVLSLICSVLYLLALPFSAVNVFLAFCCFMLTYGMLFFVCFYVQSFFVFRFASNEVTPVDDDISNLKPITNEHETAHFCVETTSLTKLAKKLRLGTVYKCKADSEDGAVKLLEFNVTDSGLTLMLKNVSIGEKVFDGSEFVLMDAKDREVCRGRISNIACDTEMPQ